MNDNKKPNAELDAEAMEQVSGGGGIVTTASDAEKKQYCDMCGQETKWIYFQGKWVCGTCGKGGNSQKIYYTR